MGSTSHSSRLPGFYDLSLSERTRIAAVFSNLTSKEEDNLRNFSSLDNSLTDTFIENAIGTYSLPLGVATNFIINGEECLVPMVVEESSVVAAASYGAKLARAQGGFIAHSSDPIMTGQIQIKLKKTYDYDRILNENKKQIIEYANSKQSRLVERGGGLKDITWYFIKEINSLVVLLHINTCDAMGANIVNTMCEKLSVLISELFPHSEMGLRILSNLNTQRMTTAQCRIPSEVFHPDKEKAWSIAKRIEDAWLFAWHDIYRGTTHNKGVMNGIDPIVIATGNDWRAIEAGVHAYASLNGRYRPVTKWQVDEEGYLNGSLTIPLAVGTVGGVTKLHPTAQVSLKVLGNPCAKKLAQIICSVGLAQNLSALKALSNEGIQKGHMNLHKKNLDLLHQQIPTSTYTQIVQ
jgi:hydroxymethylglutaryl-CoA reductase